MLSLYGFTLKITSLKATTPAINLLLADLSGNLV